MRAYRNQDGKKRKQKALPMMVLRKMSELALTEWQEAVSWLLIGAIFFAMRSCEYLNTNISEVDRRTRILRMRNITFKKDGKQLQHDDAKLDQADIVIIRFEFQKNDKRDIQVHMFTTSDSTLNPVIAWARTVQRVRSYSESTDDTTVCSFRNTKGKIVQIQSIQVRDWLKNVVNLIGPDILGFTSNDVGLHSNRSGGAMAMFLSKTSTIIMMRVGRWSSEAFLEYIRKQIENFTVDVSENMIKFESFINVTNEPSIELQSSNDNENGPDRVPFSVNYSQASLRGRDGTVE
jgi:hypothetical protein